MLSESALRANWKIHYREKIKTKIVINSQSITSFAVARYLTQSAAPATP
jgi:hypothetical protein